MRRARLAFMGALALTGLPHGIAQAQTGLELRVGSVTMVSQRSAEYAGTVGTGSGVMPGAEVLVRLRYVGLVGRLVGGTFSADSGSEAAGRVSAGDVRVLAGPPWLAADVGYGRRGFSGVFGDRSWPVVRLGVRSELAIGASGMSAEFLAAYSIGVGGGDGSSRERGREAETRLVYTPGRLPIYAAIGYRHERFTVSTLMETRPEEVSGIVFVAGARITR